MSPKTNSIHPTPIIDFLNKTVTDVSNSVKNDRYCREHMTIDPHANKTDQIR